MSVFKKQRKWIYIAFVIITVIIIAIIIIPKLTGNFLIGSWETSDGLRRYTFDENTLTVSSKINSYSKLYGYSYKNNTLEQIESINKDIPMGRMAEPREMAEVVYFLCSDKNTYLTGQKITIDGGYSEK